MEFDEVPGSYKLLYFTRLSPQFPRGKLRHRHRFLVFAVGLWDWDGYISLIESRNLIVVRRSGIGFVSGAFGQVKVEHLRPFTDQDALLRQSDARRCRGTDVGDKNALPNGGALRRLYILNVKHEFGKALVENPRLNF